MNGGFLEVGFYKWKVKSKKKHRLNVSKRCLNDMNITANAA